jgi:hypothetical protein
MYDCKVSESGLASEVHVLPLYEVTIRGKVTREIWCLLLDRIESLHDPGKNGRVGYAF